MRSYIVFLSVLAHGTSRSLRFSVLGSGQSSSLYGRTVLRQWQIPASSAAEAVTVARFRYEHTDPDTGMILSDPDEYCATV